LLFENAKAQDAYAEKNTKVEKDISVDFPFESKFIDLGTDTVHYVESGEGDPIILLHGLPANSYLWLNIIPNIDDNKKVIALDFLGFGKSSFPKDRNVSVEVQYKMLTDFIEAKQLKNVTLFIQDIGSIVGMLYAIREPQNVKGMALFEAPFMPADVIYTHVVPERMLFNVVYQILLCMNLVFEQYGPNHFGC
jgi:haloalkane dehalogenase